MSRHCLKPAALISESQHGPAGLQGMAGSPQENSGGQRCILLRRVLALQLTAPAPAAPAASLASPTMRMETKLARDGSCC
eukprot:755236-Hanusia_phi.AAC.1